MVRFLEAITCTFFTPGYLQQGINASVSVVPRHIYNYNALGGFDSLWQDVIQKNGPTRQNLPEGEWVKTTM